MDCEIIVVDQESEDGTDEIAVQAGAKVIRVSRSPFYSPPSKSRNVGATHAQGSILVHLDADMELESPTIFLEIASAFEAGARAAIIHETDVGLGFWASVKALERRCYWGSEVESARVIDRILFDEIGGYDTSVSSGEDFDIAARVAARSEIYRSPTLVLTHHTGSLSLRRLLAKKFSYGRTMRSYLDRAESVGALGGRRLVRVVVTSVVRNWRLGTSNPLPYLMILPLRAVEMLALVLGDLVQRCSRSRSA